MNNFLFSITKRLKIKKLKKTLQCRTKNKNFKIKLINYYSIFYFYLLRAELFVKLRKKLLYNKPKNFKKTQKKWFLNSSKRLSYYKFIFNRNPFIFYLNNLKLIFLTIFKSSIISIFVSYYIKKNYFINISKFYKKSSYFISINDNFKKFMLKKSSRLFYKSNVIQLYKILIGWRIVDGKLFLFSFNNFFSVVHFKRHPIIAKNFRFFFNYMVKYVNKRYSGLSVAIRGKFGIGGSVKKRKFYFKVGYGTGTTNIHNNLVLYKFQIWTATGVLGTTLHLSNFPT